MNHLDNLNQYEIDTISRKFNWFVGRLGSHLESRPSTQHNLYYALCNIIQESYELFKTIDVMSDLDPPYNNDGYMLSLMVHITPFEVFNMTLRITLCRNTVNTDIEGLSRSLL